MKIFLITPHFAPEVGGIEHHVLNLAYGLSERHQVKVITCGKNNGWNARAPFEVVRLPYITPPAYPYETLSNFKIPNIGAHFSEVLRDDTPDVVHIHGHHYPISWFAATSFRNTPLALTLHGMYALNPNRPRGKTFLEEVFNKTIFSFLLQRVDAVIGLTPTITNYARQYSCDETRFYSIPNGIDLELYQRSLRERMRYRLEYEMPSDKNVVLFIGRFSRAKGVLELAVAIRSILRQRKDVIFMLAGGGPNESLLRAMLKGLEEAKFVGWLPHRNIHKLEIAADVLVMPSKWEALPITMIEGIAAQMHIVTTPVGGIVDILKNYKNKTYIDGFTATSVALALNKALGNLPRKEAKSVPDFARLFDWDNIVRKIEGVYRAIVQFNEGRSVLHA